MNAFDKKTINNMKWSIFERISTQGISFVVSIALSRFLMPEEYGDVAIVLIFINFANTFVANGIPDSLIRKKGSEQIDFCTMFWVELLLSTILYAILFSVAPYISIYRNNKKLSYMIRVLSIKIPLSSLNTIQHAYIYKNILFKKMFLSSFFGTTVSGIIGVLMAFNGFGAWSLIAQYLLDLIIDSFVMLFTIDWKPKLAFSLKVAKEHWEYGSKLLLTSFVNTFYLELRNMIIGFKYSSADLAYYSKGSQFPSIINDNIDTSVNSVIFPTFSNNSDETAKVKKIFENTLSMYTFISFPIMLGMFSVSDEIITILLTDKWLMSSVYLRMSCLVYMMQPIQSLNWQLLKSLGMSDLCFRLEIAKKIIGLCLIVLLSSNGVILIALGEIIQSIISAFINAYNSKQLINYSLYSQMKTIYLNLIQSVVMATIVFVASEILNSFCIFNVLVITMMKIIIGIISYMLLSLVFKNRNFYLIINYFKEV